MKSINCLFILFVQIFLSCIAHADSAYNDSIAGIIQTSGNNEVKASNYILLGKIYLKKDLKKAMDCFDNAIDLGYKNKLLQFIAEGYDNKGIVYINMGEQENAHSCLDSAMKYHSMIKNKAGIASVTSNYGNLYYSVGDYTRSLKYFLSSLEMREKIDDKLGQAKSYNGIANIYLAENDLERALTWYTRSLDLNKITKNSSIQVTALCNIGQVFVRQKKYDQALSSYYQAISVADTTNNKDGLASAYLGLSEILIDQNKFNEGLIYAKKVERLLSEIGSTFKINNLYIFLGDIYFKMKDYKKSVEYYDLLYRNGIGMNMKQYQRIALEGLSETYAKLNNSERAYYFQSKLMTLNDTLFKEERIKQIAEMQTKFETERKEQENQILAGKLKVQSLELSKNFYLMIGLGGLFLLSVVIAWLVVRQNKLRFNQAQLQLEQKLLRSQMNPHFIFNSLTSIESFIYENQPKEAGKYLSDFARLMRLILENSSEEFIPLNKEIKTLEYYLVLQKLRLEDNLTYNITTNGIEDLESIYIPPMLTQPFIENSIEHGIRGNKNEGHIDIEFKMIESEHLQIQVTDNGKGIDSRSQTNNERKNNHKSMALQVTKERLQVLNKSKKQKVTFSISDLSHSAADKTGTKVIFTIPLV
jgi:tetratricopeptide (TPR) repeat protein